jgi:hypothetical protein
MAKKILSEEFRRMQKLAGIITEEQLNENVASEMVKFVSQNFDTIKANFLQSELEMLDDIEAEEEDYSNLNSQMDVSSAEELINVINERSMGVDLEDDMDASELFDMIKELASGQLDEEKTNEIFGFGKSKSQFKPGQKVVYTASNKVTTYNGEYIVGKVFPNGEIGLYEPDSPMKKMTINAKPEELKLA